MACRRSLTTFPDHKSLPKSHKQCGRPVCTSPLPSNPSEANPSPIIQTIDWTYIFYALNYQLAAILLACSPRWYLYQALGSNFLWILPWAIVVTKISVPQSTAWTYYAIIFGGALVFDFFDVGITLLIWATRLMRGKIKVGVVQSAF